MPFNFNRCFYTSDQEKHLKIKCFSYFSCPKITFFFARASRGRSAPVLDLTPDPRPDGRDLPQTTWPLTNLQMQQAAAGLLVDTATTSRMWPPFLGHGSHFSDMAIILPFYFDFTLICTPILLPVLLPFYHSFVILFIPIYVVLSLRYILGIS